MGVAKFFFFLTVDQGKIVVLTFGFTDDKKEEC